MYVVELIKSISIIVITTISTNYLLAVIAIAQLNCIITLNAD